MEKYNQQIQHREDVTTTGPTSFIGTVKVVIFERSLFRIISVEVEDADFNWDQESITVKGQLGDIVEGDRYEFEGRVVDDQRYGLQFASTGCHVVMPQSSGQLTSYLQNHHVKLNHPRKSAKILFEALGSQAMNMVVDDPHCLDDIIEIDSADRKQLFNFFSKLDLGNSTGKIIKQLKKFGFSERQVNLIFDKYGIKTLTTIAKNPYRISMDLFDSGISFKAVDQIAQRFYSVAINDSRRISGAILYALKILIVSQGGTCVQRDMLLAFASRLLDYQIDPSAINEQLLKMNKDGTIEIENSDHIYESSFYDAEWKISQKLFELLKQNQNEDAPSTDDIKNAIRDVEQENGYDYDQVQKDAISEALKTPVMLLTGGPGTGKTTIVNGIVETFLKLNPEKIRDDVMLVAPTGRAAKQVNSATGIEASTIHRLLGLTADINDGQLMEMDFEPLETDLLIVDEMSMTSTAVFTALISAVGNGTHVVLVGDCDQLPSVGPGQVFYDLLSTSTIPQRRLHHIYRQSENSSIIPLAHHINEGDVSTSLFAPSKPNQYAHRQFIRSSYRNIPELISQAVQLYHNKYDVPIMDIQILAPIHGGIAGTDNINKVLQAVLNPDNEEKSAIELKNRVLRVGDKVMQTVNDPDNNVFNGDLGIIKSIEGQNVINGSNKSTAKQKVVVDFDGQEVEYLRLNEINALQLAYCMTIHKAQGSQAPVVIVSMVDEYFPTNPQSPTIMHRNLLYTAVTRSSRALLMVGKPSAFVRCAESPTEYRQTTLKDRIEKIFETEKNGEKVKLPTNSARKQTTHKQPDVEHIKELTPEIIESNLIDPMIGMDGIRPEDF